MLLFCTGSALLLYLAVSVNAVDIDFGRTPEDVIPNFRLNIQTCRDIPPGACCMPRRNFPPYMAVQFGAPAQTNYNRVTFTRLEHGHVTAAFVPQGDKVGCDGATGGTGWGPGTWTYDHPPAHPNNRLSGGGDAVNRISGASYVVMPKALPFDDATDAWLSAEGMVGLVWPKGNWFPTAVGSSARTRLLEAAAALLHQGTSELGVKMKRNVNSHIRSPERGLVFCRGPTRWTWVNVIMVNGTEFKAEGGGTGHAIYTSGDGRVLNFTESAG
ncbi:MAG: hypothetical protein Q9202_001301 [Teloschistes flavicans]